MDARLEQYFTCLGIDLQGVRANLHGWDVSTATRNGEDVGFVIIKGPEIHMLSTNPRKAMSRKNIHEYLVPIIEQFGYATTRVPIEEENHRLREKLGFQYTWEDAQFTYWAVTEIPFQKGTHLE